MEIASFNVNSIRARMPVLTRWLQDKKPDILCIQETKVTDDKFPVSEIESLGYNVAFKGQKSYNGVAILSVSDLDEITCGFDKIGNDEGARLIAARIHGINIVNTYIPQGTAPDSEKFLYKLDWFSRLYEFFNSNYRNSDPIVWIGDFNVAPEPIDVHDPEALYGQVGYHPDEHSALKKIKEWGFTDVFRKHCPESGYYSFWDYRIRGAISRGLGWRVDHIWATDEVLRYSKDSWIDIEPRRWERPSDHTPIVAKFSF